MLKVNQEKYEALKRLSNEEGVIAALAIDQRGSLKMIAAASEKEIGDEGIIRFKEMVSEELTRFHLPFYLIPNMVYQHHKKEPIKRDSSLLMKKQGMMHPNQAGYRIYWNNGLLSV